MAGLLDLYPTQPAQGMGGGGWNDALQARQNSLVGMGLGLMGGGWAGGMRGYEAGAGTDARLAQAAQQGALHRASLAQQAQLAREQMAQQRALSPLGLYESAKNDPEKMAHLFPNVEMNKLGVDAAGRPFFANQLNRTIEYPPTPPLFGGAGAPGGGTQWPSPPSTGATSAPQMPPSAPGPQAGANVPFVGGSGQAAPTGMNPHFGGVAAQQSYPPGFANWPLKMQLAYLEKQGSMAAERQQNEMQGEQGVKQGASAIVQHVDRAEELLNKWKTTGLAGKVAGMLPWDTERKELEAELNSVRAGMSTARYQAMAQGGHNMSLRNKEAWNRIESELGSLNPEAPEATRNSLRNIRQYYSYLMGRESPNAPAPLYPGDYRNTAGTVIHQRGNAPMTWDQAQQQGWK